jgi:DNA polymerase-3 subunit epsilon
MRNEIADIGYELTGNELIALILESNEIKQHLPKYNRAQRRSGISCGLYYYKDENGYLRLKIEKNNREQLPLTTFTSVLSAKSHLFVLAEAFNLCQKLCGLFDTQGACFHYNIHKCNGACIGKEPAEIYNTRVLQAIEPYRFEEQNFIVIDKGRSMGEKSVICVENGKYLGHGFIDFEYNDNISTEILKDCIKPFPDNRDVQQILKNYVKRNKVESILTW